MAVIDRPPLDGTVVVGKRGRKGTGHVFAGKDTSLCQLRKSCRRLRTPGYAGCLHHNEYQRLWQQAKRILDGSKVKTGLPTCDKCRDEHTEAEGCMERSPYPAVSMNEHLFRRSE